MPRVARLIAPVLALAVLLPASVAAGEARERLDELLAVRLDASQCWRIRDLFLEREDFKFYLNDGYLILSEQYQGRDVAALFLARASSDFGELVLIPPTTSERESLARFTGETVMNERFRSALMLFTDGTAAALRAQIAAGASAKPDPAEGEALSARWTPVLKNILEGVAGRLMHDSLSRVPLEDGFFAAAIGGGRHGRFDVVVDPQLHEQISVGQTAWRAERRFYEIWCQFPSRSVRAGKRKRLENVGVFHDYRLDVDLLPDLSMQVRAEAKFAPGRDGFRTFGFEIASRLQVSSVLVEGEPADFLQMETSSATASARRNNSLVFVVLPEQLERERPVAVTVEYGGTVISRAGDNVYFVGSRANWYPRAEPGFTDFEMTFRHPANLDLVATGELVEDDVDGDIRIARFRSEGPIRTAGFNLGRYVKTTREIDGYRVEVLANRVVEERLRPKSGPVILPDISGPRRRGGLRPPSQILIRPTAERAPNPAARIEELADRDAEAFQFFLERFGPPPTRQVIVSPIPAGFGQGFPGLVYAATLSYLAPSDSPLDKMNPSERQFYLELLRPHEIAHQWWGNNVSIESGADLWIMEALATYSSLLFLEEKQGAESLQTTLAGFLDHLLDRNQDNEPIHSAGPVSLGERLIMAKFPTAYRLVLYEKGAWIFHMLRGVLGDEQFFGLLNELSERYRLARLNTDEIRKAAAARLPEDYPDRGLRDFFDQWVRGAAIPELRVKQRHEEGAIVGELLQGGVPDHFVTPVTLRAVFASGDPIDIEVWTEGESTPFRIPSPRKPVRIEIDPDAILLAVKRR